MSKLTHEDKLYWKEATKAVKKSKLVDEFELDDFILPKPAKKIAKKAKPFEKKIEKKIHSQKPEIKTENVKIEARIDLHGLRLNEAKHATNEFARKAFLAHKKYILVITGRSGKIKQEFEHWLDLPEIANFLRSYKTALPKHGGIGAYYLMLKKHR